LQRPGTEGQSLNLERFLEPTVGRAACGLRAPSTFGNDEFPEEQQYRVGIGGASLPLQWKVRSFEQPWWQAAYKELFHRWICVLFVLCGRLLIVYLIELISI